MLLVLVLMLHLISQQLMLHTIKQQMMAADAAKDQSLSHNVKQLLKTSHHSVSHRVPTLNKAILACHQNTCILAAFDGGIRS